MRRVLINSRKDWREANQNQEYRWEKLKYKINSQTKHGIQPWIHRKEIQLKNFVVFPCRGDHWNRDRTIKSKISQIKKITMITSFYLVVFVRKLELWMKISTMWDFRLPLCWPQMLLTRIQLNLKIKLTEALKNWPKERKAEANSRL